MCVYSSLSHDQVELDLIFQKNQTDFQDIEVLGILSVS